jgi:hypothetical protein
MNHSIHLETAFLQLSFALKLQAYFERFPPNKEVLDLPYTIKSHDGLDQTHLPSGQFHTDDNIFVATENNIQVCFAAAAITLWEAVNETGRFETSSLDPSKNEEQMIAALIYQLRCCFAHGTAVPKWEIRNSKYKIIYKLRKKSIDLRFVDGQVFSFESIDGFGTLWILRSEVERKILTPLVS